MINRVLIRIKVVQLLYSYLLCENNFNLESQPSQPTREKRFAYALYLDMLAIMAGIADGISRRGGDKPLYSTRFIRRIAADDRVKSLLHKYALGGCPFESVERALTEKVKESALYKNFLKSDDPGSLADEKIWQNIFEHIIMLDTPLNNYIKGMENYSLSGVDRMRSMMEATFRNFYASSDHLPDALRTLRESMEKARELYLRLMQLPADITRLRRLDIDEQMKKFIVTSAEMNPNMRFVENQYVDLIEHNEELQSAIDKIGRSMNADDEPMLRALLRAIMASDIYKEYMEAPATDFRQDCEFWRNIYRNVIFVNPDFLEALEERSVFWNDDLDIMGTFALKTAKRIADSHDESSAESFIAKTDDEALLLPMYKDDEDAHFGAELFQAVIKNKETYRDYIDEVVDKKLWDAERLAYMDVVVIMTALAEILNFPKIPLNVSINEYIEIAKAYSTGKSAQFVNGMLAAILNKLRADGKLVK